MKFIRVALSVTFIIIETRAFAKLQRYAYWRGFPFIMQNAFLLALLLWRETYFTYIIFWAPRIKLSYPYAWCFSDSLVCASIRALVETASNRGLKNERGTKVTHRSKDFRVYCRCGSFLTACCTRTGVKMYRNYICESTAIYGSLGQCSYRWRSLSFSRLCEN